MPTITLSWTDLALFGLTAGLIGGVVLVGRATASTSHPSSKLPPAANSSKKKKNKPKKPASSLASDPAAASPSSDHSNSLLRSPPPSHLPPPQNLAPELSPRQANDRSSKRKSHPEERSHPLQKVNDPEFPLLSAAKDDQSAGKPKSNPKRPLAERRQPPARKTIVDDMIDEDVEKPHKMARVMAIVDPASESPEAPESDLEDGWEKVPDSKKSRATGISISIGSSSPRPPASTSAAQSTQALSKRQRQNAKKKEAAKAIKEAEETERLGRLSSHKRQQERVRVNSQANNLKSNDSSAQKPKSQTTGGGMKAVIGEDGRLIWE